MEYESIMPLFKALADQTRIRIIALLSTRELAVQEIAAAVDLAPATISHHLTLLRRAGLVSGRREQYYTLYRFTQQPLLDALGVLTRASLDPAETADDVGKFDRKVLRDYLMDGRLTTIPAQRKKRDVILRYLASQFDIGRTYSEKEVNTLLVTYHDDVATLRRELVADDARLLARDQGLYWRIADA